MLPPRSTWPAQRIIETDATAYDALLRNPISRSDSFPSRRICGSQMPTPYDPTRNPNCTPPRISTRGSLSAGPRWRTSRGRFSPATRSRTVWRSSVGQPRGVLGALGHHVQHHEAQDDDRQPFENEQPLPAGHPGNAVHLEQRPRQRAADDRRDRDRHHEPRDDAGAVLGRKPVAEVERHTRKKPRLGGAEQEAEEVEAARPADEHRRRGNQAPADHDPGDPPPRAHAVEDHVARHFEEAVAQEQDAGAPAELGRGQPDLLVHRQGGEPYVVAVEVVEDIGEDQDRQQTPGDLRKKPGVRVVHCRGRQGWDVMKCVQYSVRPSGPDYYPFGVCAPPQVRIYSGATL